AAAEACAHDLEELGLTVERHPVPAETVRAHGMVSATNLIVRRRFGSGPIIALNAHGDVVPPGDGWTQDPYGGALVGGWLYGRGAAVSKSDIAAYAFALLALEAVGEVAHGTVELHVTWDEEAGGAIGPGWLLEQGLSHPDLVVCAGFPYSVVTAHNGCLHLEVEVVGRSAHAAKPATGIDALEAATHVLQALYAERPKLAARTSAVAGIGSPQLTVGLIRGGINTNVVPDRVRLRLDRRLIPEENGGEVEAGLTRLIEGAVAAVPGAKVTVRRLLLAEPLQETPASRRLGEALAEEASAVLGEPVGLAGVPLYTDARHYAEAGIPTVLFGAGPRTIEEANAHRADERVPVRELHLATVAIARALQKLLAT
ncbi:MAG: M20/M25/M40 family metallo-hydrolase, partial [Pseudomonadota bacterium]